MLNPCFIATVTGSRKWELCLDRLQISVFHFYVEDKHYSSLYIHNLVCASTEAMGILPIDDLHGCY